MPLYKLKYKHIDPDTGNITEARVISILFCSDENVKLIHHCISSCDEDPNSEYFYEEIDGNFYNIEKSKSMELLNSEGPILTAVLRDYGYEIIDQYKKHVGVLSIMEIQNFVHGGLIITDSKGEAINYSKYPGSMKPDLKKLDEFIGINTIGKTY
jgi:hypothetical protein